MTKKDFEVIASIIKEVRNTEGIHDGTIAELTFKLSEYFTSIDEDFNQQGFLDDTL